MEMFYYEAKFIVPNGPDKGQEKVVFLGFNPAMVKQAVLRENGSMHIYLNDWHEEIEQIPIMSNTQKVKGYKDRKYQSTTELILEGEAVQRFMIYTTEYNCYSKPPVKEESVPTVLNNLEPETQYEKGRVDEMPQEEEHFPDEKVLNIV